jgi:hypothetical protein
LRHALATTMLRNGAALVEISPVLRHRDLATPPSTQRLTWTRCVTSPSPGQEVQGSALGQAVEDYLRLRRSLGHDLADAGRLLTRFVAYMDGLGAETITVETAVAWAQQPDAEWCGFARDDLTRREAAFRSVLCRLDRDVG